MTAHNVNVEIHFDNRGVYVATSPDMPGLHVVADTKELVKTRIPEAVQLLARAEGRAVGRIILV